MKLAMENAGITTDEMAEYLLVHRNTVGNWFTGRTQPKSRVLRAWAVRCNVPYEWLLDGTGTA